jgi:hypothetical protein
MNIENLHDSMKLKELRIVNRRKFMSVNIDMEDTIEQMWNKVKTNLLEPAETVLGHQPRNHSGGLLKTAGTQHKRKPRSIESS